MCILSMASLRGLPDHPGKRVVPTLHHGIVALGVGVDTIASHRGRVESRPAVHDCDGTFRCRSLRSPIRNRLVQIHDPLPAVSAV